MASDKRQKFAIIGLVVATTAAIIAMKASDSDTKGNEQKEIDENRVEKLQDHITKIVDPITAEPSTALETMAFLESFSPSLMRRDSKMQGIITGFSVLSARGVSNIVEKLTSVVSGDKNSWRKLLVRAGIIGVSEMAISAVDEKGDTIANNLIKSSARVTSAATTSGLIFDAGQKLSNNDGSEKKIIRSALVGALMTAGIVIRGKGLLATRKHAIESGPGDPTNRILPAAASGIAAVIIGRSIAVGYKGTGSVINSWLGDNEGKKATSKIANALLWAGATTGLYYGGIGYIGKANEKIEDRYSEIPELKEVSGSEDSVLDFKKLGAQGRRFVSEPLSPDEIKDVMDIRSAKQPIRLFVGYNSTSIFPSARAERALQELDRTNAFDRKYLLLVSPTGTGWVDQTLIESAELLAKGDIATCVIQYARFPSFLSLQKVALGRRQFQLLLWGVKLRIQQLPKNKRPKVLVFGESLGAWTSSDTIMHIGTKGFDHYGIDRALWVGMPKLSKWAAVQKQLSKDKSIDDVTKVFDNIDQFNELNPRDRKKLRAIILNHDNDPIARLHPNLLYREPSWLKDDQPRGRGVPESAEWLPITTFLQTGIDAGNAMNVTPGKFRSHGHDYRGDMAEFVAKAYEMNASEKQIENVDEALKQFEITRSKRPKVSEQE